jgi:hypothetical protein
MIKTIAYLTAFGVVVGTGCLLAPPAAQAANAGAPYTNIDRSNDRGNDTGDSRVDGLNSAQLGDNYRGPVEQRATAPNPSMTMAPQSGEPAPPPELVPHQ